LDAYIVVVECGVSDGKRDCGELVEVGMVVLLLLLFGWMVEGLVGDGTVVTSTSLDGVLHALIMRMALVPLWNQL